VDTRGWVYKWLRQKDLRCAVELMGIKEKLKKREFWPENEGIIVDLF
jgi:hypothetical protein